jgi:uncharacterized repeat protein (TIGR03803 family)
MIASDGNLYGTLANGPPAGTGPGEAFKISMSGVLTRIHIFGASYVGADGQVPDTPILQGSDGNFYGLTYTGGTGGCGVIYKITPSNGYTVLRNLSLLDLSNGCSPPGGPPLVQGADGNLYGILGAGSGGNGLFFKITTMGIETPLYSFSGTEGMPANLLLASDGNFYGTTCTGGLSGNGTIFKITASGTKTVIYNFSSNFATYSPIGTCPTLLIQASDGNLYGVTSSGGLNGAGAFYSITLTGTNITPYYAFQNALMTGDPSGINGLIQASDGNFYGSSFLGGSQNLGTVFKLITSP